VQHRKAAEGSETGSDSRIPIASPTLPDFESLLPRLREIWSSGELTNGRTVAELEHRVGEMLPERHLVAVSSCTSGLMLALRALGVHGEVLLPSFTFVATAHAVAWNDCTPVWVDCDPETLNIDVADLERKITPRTAAIVAVYVSGNPPELGMLQELAARHGVPLVLDAAHAMGASFQGAPAGTFGDAEVFSLSPTKTITTCEGGLVTLRDPEVARRVRIGRNYANPGNYDCEFVGLNARMSEIHALVGLQSLALLRQNIQERRRMAALYAARLQGIAGLRLQQIANGNLCSYKDFSLRVVRSEFGATRDAVRLELERNGIETRTYFDPPVHRQAAYRPWAPRSGELPRTESTCREVLNLPLFVGLEDADVDRIVGIIRAVAARTRVPA
jgi:dTDP-4-amino-4,6-dideoxygalactose transaminase